MPRNSQKQWCAKSGVERPAPKMKETKDPSRLVPRPTDLCLDPFSTIPLHPAFILFAIITWFFLLRRSQIHRILAIVCPASTAPINRHKPGWLSNPCPQSIMTGAMLCLHISIAKRVFSSRSIIERQAAHGNFYLSITTRCDQ